MKLSDLEIWIEDGRHYAVYDAGSHQVAMRKDEITEEEAKRGCSSEKDAMEMLFTLQARLTRAGIDPYVSNFSSP